MIYPVFLDNRYYYDFMERAAKIGISCPILPGIMPITDFRKIKEFADFCHTTIPKAIQDKMEPILDDAEEMKKIGIYYAINQCQDLLKTV